MSTQDAYAPPQSTVRDVSGGSGLMTDSIVTSLRKTRPWVLLISIIGFIFTALMVIGGVSMMMGGGAMSEMAGVDGDVMPGGFMFGMGAMYLVIAIIYFMSSLYLLRYAGSIKRAVTGMNVTDLEVALSQQASFWKLMGILTLISLIVMVVGLVAGIGGAMFLGAQ